MIELTLMLEQHFISNDTKMDSTIFLEQKTLVFRILSLNPYSSILFFLQKINH